MEFRAPAVAAEQNAKALSYLTKSLKNVGEGKAQVNELIKELGNAIDIYPEWHPILIAPYEGEYVEYSASINNIPAYKGADHTVEFVRGFVTCPYSEYAAESIVERVKPISGLYAYRLDIPLYAEDTYPVVVEATDVVCEADGTIRSKDALIWFIEKTVKDAPSARVAETWWNIRSLILGSPYGSRSSLFVNQNTGAHMRKILEAMNNSGMFGPIKEMSLDMISEKKRNAICETLLMAAVDNWDKSTENFSFELRGEVCKASMKDTWNDDHEWSVRVEIGNYDLFVSGFYYPKDKSLTYTQPRGKKILAEKFI